jgi:hypothetical protein
MESFYSLTKCVERNEEALFQSFKFKIFFCVKLVWLQNLNANSTPLNPNLMMPSCDDISKARANFSVHTWYKFPFYEAF